jgi:hypothetical protein
MRFARYAADQCVNECAKGSNLCEPCKKLEAGYMEGIIGKWHGRKGGEFAKGSHMLGSEWAVEQNAANAERAAKAAAAIAGQAAAAGGGGGEVKKAKAAAAKAKTAAKEAAAAAAPASNSSERNWGMALGRAGMTIARGANVKQIERHLAVEEERRRKAAAAAEKAHRQTFKAALAGIRARRRASGSPAAAVPRKTRKAAAPRIYAPASAMPAGVANWMRTPSSPRAEGIRAPPATPRRSSSRRRSSARRRPVPSLAAAAAASSGSPNFGDLEAELALAMSAAGRPAGGTEF